MTRKYMTPPDFDAPTKLPENDIQHRQWQEKNRSWWENHPMRYDWNDVISGDEFSREFFREIDSRFFSNVKHYMPWESIPFDPIIDYKGLAEKDVLEIGMGSGSHAQLLAVHANTYTGIDITEYSVKSTSKRMQSMGLKNSTIMQMDAEALQFENESFDFIWSWGVIHHSANTERIIREMHRVLRPGGQAVTMVYHRNMFNYYLIGALALGIIKGGIFKNGSIHKTVQQHTDGAVARYYTISEWQDLVAPYFQLKKISIYGSKAELVPLPKGKIKDRAFSLMSDRFARLFTNRLKLGSFLVSILEKK